MASCKSCFNEGGKTGFGKTYYSHCQSTCTPINSHVLSGALDSHQTLLCLFQRLHLVDYSPIACSLKSNTSLRNIYIHHREEAKRQYTLQDKNIQGLRNTLIRSLNLCIQSNPRLVTLELAGLTLTLHQVSSLSKALNKSQTIQRLSFSRSLLGDEGLCVLASGIKALPSLVLLNLHDCNLTWKSGTVIGDIVKYQTFKAVSLHWESTLRHNNMHKLSKKTQEPLELSMHGLHTLFISKNPLADKGLGELLKQLEDVISLVAIYANEIECTQIMYPNIKKFIMRHPTLISFDLRCNRIGESLLATLTNQFNTNKELTATLNQPLLTQQEKEKGNFICGSVPLSEDDCIDLVHLDRFILLSKPLRKSRHFPRKRSLAQQAITKVKEDRDKDIEPTISKQPQIPLTPSKISFKVKTKPLPQTSNSPIYIPTMESPKSLEDSNQRLQDEWAEMKVTNQQLLFQNELLQQKLEYLERFLLNPNSKGERRKHHKTHMIVSQPPLPADILLSKKDTSPSDNDKIIPGKENEKEKTEPLDISENGIPKPPVPALNAEEGLVTLLNLVEHSLHAFGSMVDKLNHVQPKPEYQSHRKKSHKHKSASVLSS